MILVNGDKKLDGNLNVNIGPSDIDIGTRDLNQEDDSKQPMIQIDCSHVLDNSQDDLTNPDQLPIDDGVNDPRKVDTKLLVMDNGLKDSAEQGCNARKVNCGRVYSLYILKPVLFGQNL